MAIAGLAITDADRSRLRWPSLSLVISPSDTAVLNTYSKAPAVNCGKEDEEKPVETQLVPVEVDGPFVGYFSDGIGGDPDEVCDSKPNCRARQGENGLSRFVWEHTIVGHTMRDIGDTYKEKGAGDAAFEGGIMLVMGMMGGGKGSGSGVGKAGKLKWRGGGALGKTGVNISKHAAERLAQRGITRSMVDRALTKGTRYWDVKNASVAHVLDRGMASGKTLIIGHNPLTNTVTTAMTRSKPFNPLVKLPDGTLRFIPML